MGTKVKTFVGSLAVYVLFAGTAAAQTSMSSDPSALDAVLCRSLCERIQMPLAFATRDSVFALSLPADEPAEVYVQLIVGKNGKVKEKLTRINANHIGAYVAPAFISATKNLSVDRSILAGINGKDTSLILTFPLEYQCVMDTTITASRAGAYPYRSRLFYDNVITPWATQERKFRETLPGATIGSGFDLENPYIAQSRLPKPDAYSGPVSFYIVFLKDQQE